MADGVIEQLRIDISADVKENTAQNVDSLSVALERLDKIVTDNNFVKLKDLASLLSSLGASGAGIQQAQQGINKIESSVKAVATSNEKLQSVSNALGQSTSKLSDAQIRYNNVLLSSTNAQVNYNRALEQRKSIVSEVSRLEKQLAEIEDYRQRTAAGEKVKLTAQQYEQLGRVAEITKELSAAQAKLSLANATVEKAQNANTKASNNLELANRRLAESTEQAKQKSGGLAAMFGRLEKSFFRVLTYRVFRSIFKQIVSAFQTGMRNIVQYSEEANATMSNLAATGTAIKNAFGVLLVNVLQAFEPAITSLGDTVLAVLNEINRAFAVMRGESEYNKVIKANENLADSYKKVNKQLSSFDKFEVLRKGDETPVYFETVSTEVGAASEKMSDLIGALKIIGIVLAGLKFGPIGVLISLLANAYFTNEDFRKSINTLVTVALPKVFKAMTDIINVLTPVLVVITDIISKIIVWLDKNNALAGTITALIYLLGIFLVIDLVSKVGKWITSLGKVITSMKNLETATLATKLAVLGIGVAIGFLIADALDGLPSEIKLIVGALLLLIGAAVAATIAVSGIQSAWSLGLAAAAITAGILLVKSSIESAVPDVKTYARGGIVDAQSGSMFVMNELGKPELLYENTQGQTAVANHQSILNAFRQALAEDREERSTGSVTINLPAGQTSKQYYITSMSDLRQAVADTGTRF